MSQQPCWTRQRSGVWLFNAAGPPDAHYAAAVGVSSIVSVSLSVCVPPPVHQAGGSQLV